jgi:hypothetical protein
VVDGRKAKINIRKIVNQNRNMLLTESITKSENAPVVVLFGGNPFRRDEVVKLVQSIGEINIYGALSEEEGLAKIKSLSRVDLVLIGGRYSTEQRKRIRKFVYEELPTTKITEPGFEYPYENEAIKNDIKLKLGL